MKKYEQLTEDERVIRTLVFAIESLFDDISDPESLAYLNLKLEEARAHMKKNDIPKV